MSNNKTILFLLCIITSSYSNTLFSQTVSQNISFNASHSTFEVTLGASKTIKNFIVSVKTTGTISVDANFKIELGNSTSTPNKEFKILTPTLFIPKNTADKKEFEVILEFPSRVEEKAPSIIELKLVPIDEGSKKIKIGPNTSHIIIIKNGKKIKSFDDKQSFKAEDFRIDLGTNFDFLDGINAGGLYANVFTFAPNLISPNEQKNKILRTKKLKVNGKKVKMVNNSFPNNQSKEEKKNNSFGLGLISGIRQNRLIGDTLKSNKKEIFYSLVSQNRQDSLNTYIKSEFKSASKTIINSTSLYLNPIFTLKENNKVAIYFGPNIEVARQSYSTKNDYKLLSSDSTTLSSTKRLRTFEPIEESKITFHNLSFGFKLPIFFQVKKININIIPSFGFSSRSSTAGSNNEWYYGVYFNAIELDSGVNLGGEVNVFRSKREGIDGTFIRTPIIGIYLSKAFNLNPLGKYKGTVN